MKLKRLYNLFFILFSALLFADYQSVAQENTSQVLLTATVYRSDSLEAIPYATVMDKKTKTGIVSDENGHFSLYIKPFDTLVISAIGYASKEYIFKRTNEKKAYDKILLDPKIYELQEVGVYSKTYQQFKNDFVKLDLPEESKAFIPQSEKVYTGNTSPTLVIAHPFTSMYNRFSRRGKELRKVESLKFQYKKRDELSKRYNKDFISKILNINGQELDSFIEFCKLSDDFITNSTDYDLVLAVQQCYLSFKSQ